MSAAERKSGTNARSRRRRGAGRGDGGVVGAPSIWRSSERGVGVRVREDASGVRVVEALVRDQYATASEAVYVVVLVPTLRRCRRR